MKGALARMRGSEMFNQVFVCRKLGVANTAASPSFCGQMVLCMLVDSGAGAIVSSVNDYGLWLKA
jgi:hypothetical protein